MHAGYPGYYCDAFQCLTNGVHPALGGHHAQVWRVGVCAHAQARGCGCGGTGMQLCRHGAVDVGVCAHVQAQGCGCGSVCACAGTGLQVWRVGVGVGARGCRCGGVTGGLWACAGKGLQGCVRMRRQGADALSAPFKSRVARGPRTAAPGRVQKSVEALLFNEQRARGRGAHLGHRSNLSENF
eukprot:1187184-Prorocentrum_minimum.AAC.3